MDCFTQKENKIMPFAATWLNLETVILSEVRQRKMVSYNIIHVWWFNC